MNIPRRRFLALTGATLSAGLLGAAVARTRQAANRIPAGVSDAFDAVAFANSRSFAELRGGRVAYVERGRGRAALFLHGFPLNSFQWRGAIERLAAHRRCIAPDFLGLGASTPAAGQSLSPNAQVDMVVELLDTLGVDAADIVASDSGGAIAQLLVVRHPTRVRTLLLTNCDTEIESPPAAMRPVIELAKQGRFADEWLARWLADPALARSPQGIGGMCYMNPAHPTDEALSMYFAPLLASAQRKDWLHVYTIALENNALAGIGPALAASKVPARVVWGMDDGIFSAAGADYLERTIAKSHGVRRLENARLFWPEERPDIVAAQARILWESARA
jgi:haloalkane dehalogenase